MKEYVLGFAFDHWDHIDNYVLLLLKDRPEWQAGRLNGLGGKVEPSDSSILHAMCREFFEECGIVTKAQEWKHFANMMGPDYQVFCFMIKLGDQLWDAKTMETESVLVTKVQDVLLGFEHTMNNVPLLLQACMNRQIRVDEIFPLNVIENPYPVANALIQ